MGILLGLLNRTPTSWIRTAGALRGGSPWIKSMTDWLPALLHNREGRIQKGLGRGLRFNGANSSVGFLLGTHDLEVQQAMAQLLQPGMTVYDIGANVGFTAILAAKQVAPNGRVVCFEPLAANAKQISRNAALNEFRFVEVRQMALGRSDGEAEFFLSASPTWGRLADAGQAPQQNGVLRVPVRSLDSLAASDHLPAPQFIKMDVEGAEADVLKGGKALLTAARPVMVIELHHTYQAVIDSLQGLDYVVRPLTAAGESASTDGEFQILVYPRERLDVEAVWTDLAAGMRVFQ
jgi:FkbM family methyltransferase